MDRNGRYVTNLRKEDFRIFEDGVEQQLDFFAPAEQSFTILLMLDTTSSMTAYRETLDRAAKVFVGLLHPDDQLIAGSFYQNEIKLNILIPATKVSALHEDIVPKFRKEGDCDTLIYDVVHDGLDRMKKLRDRKAIVLLSDGRGIGIFASARSTLREAEEQDALIYTVQFGTYDLQTPRNVSKKLYLERVEETDGYMIDLARKTGGRHFHVADIPDLQKTFGFIAEELRRQYSLGYYRKAPLEAEQRGLIKVQVDRQDLVVRAH
jgi:Ca-activated chloride channel family protein